MVLSKPYRIRVELFRLIQKHRPPAFDGLVFEESGHNVKIQWHPKSLCVLTATGRTLRSGFVNVHRATTNVPKMTSDIVAAFEESVLKPLESLNDA